jgi:hypothetical protein
MSPPQPVTVPLTMCCKSLSDEHNLAVHRTSCIIQRMAKYSHTLIISGSLPISMWLQTMNSFYILHD